MNRKLTLEPSDRLAFSLEELARQLGVSPGLLRLDAKRGKLGTTRLGRRIVVTRVQLNRYLEQGEVS